MPSTAEPEPNESNGGGVTEWFDYAISGTEAVERRLDAELAERYIPFRALVSMVPNASRRIFTEIPALSPADRCAAFHVSRVFVNAMGAYLLLRKGMQVEATTLIRSTLDTAAQAIALMRQPQKAEAWLNGKTYSPAVVRSILNGTPNVGPLYGMLSDVAHPNAAALPYHTMPVGDDGDLLWFGGSYQPKAVATLLAILTDVVLIYLNGFLECYSNRLSLQAWPLMLGFWTDVNDDLKTWASSLPSDWVAIASDVNENWITPPMPPPALDEETLNQELEKLQAYRAHKLTNAGPEAGDTG